MLNLSKTIRLTRETLQAPNLCDRFDADDLTAIGNHVWDGYNRDKFSRSRWEARTQAAMDLAMQVQKAKNFPWPDCSNVAFPLITIAALQFHSRAYPAILAGQEVVRYRVNGADPDGSQKIRADRVGQHMSYQLLEQDAAWEEQHDRLLINIPIVGCAFKKSRFDNGKGHPIGDLVLAQDLVMDYYAKSVESCQRKTHIIPTYRNDIHSGIRTGIYRDVSEEGWYTSPARPVTDATTAANDKRDGQTPPMPDDATPFTFLEQHARLDLDGDGYAEPYIVTLEESSKCVLRIVCGADRMEDIDRTATGQIIRVNAREYFTKYGFIPAPDGSIYDMGFGILLGPLNESVNSLFNQLIDAGTMSNSAGGFLGRGAKIRGGVYTFAPFQWNRVDSTGDDLRKSMFPLPVREPSQVLFALLNLLINYTNRISGSTDTMVGENPGQNTPAQTTQTMVEQGMKIYNAIFKRVWRSMKEEFKKVYILNAIYLPETTSFGEAGTTILREDYLGDPNRISPVADPNITSTQQRLQQAITIKQSAMSTPGYNLEAVERNFLSALHVDGSETMYPGPSKVPPLSNPKVQVAQMQLQAKQMALKANQQQWVVEMQEEHQLNAAKILQLQAQAAKAIAEAGGIKTGHQIAAFEAAIGAMKVHNDNLSRRIELTLKSMENQNGPSSDGAGMERLAGAPGNAGGAQAPSPQAAGAPA